METKRILIVDDSKTMVKINENILKQLGITSIDYAYDGAEGLKLFKEKMSNFDEKYDLILSDINMPILNGFELVEKIRQIDRNVGIFMITTEGGRDEVIKALRLGANNYLVKPIDKEALKSKIINYFTPTEKKN